MQACPSGSMGWPQSEQIGRPASTTSRVRRVNARAAPTGIRTSTASDSGSGELVHLVDRLRHQVSLLLLEADAHQLRSGAHL